MIDIIHKHVIPVALTLLPPQMSSQEAHAMLLTIGQQESGFEERRQIIDFSPLTYGKARSFFMFERDGGLKEVCTNHRTAPDLDAALCALRYREGTIKDLNEMMTVITHNEIAAAVCARLLLWLVPARLPRRDESATAYLQYLKGWKPGKPKAQKWSGYYKRSWEMVQPTP